MPDGGLGRQTGVAWKRCEDHGLGALSSPDMSHDMPLAVP